MTVQADIYMANKVRSKKAKNNFFHKRKLASHIVQLVLVLMWQLLPYGPL